MNIKQRLKSLLQEAEIYRSQGLMAESYSKYQDAEKLIQSIGNLKNKESLLSALAEKISALNISREKVEKGPSSPELSKKAQDLIKNLFAATESHDPDAAALEGAVVLAKFGQFDRAIEELNILLTKENTRVEAAKNILRCHMVNGNSQETVNLYHQWHSEDSFQPNQLEQVRIYLIDALAKKGVDIDLPSPAGAHADSAATNDFSSAALNEGNDEEFLDITSIGITFESGPSKGKMIEFDVNFQSGNMLSLIISKKDQSLIDDLKTGMELKEIQFYSPIAIFNGSGVVSSKTQIKSGPKQGDYCLDIRIKSN